MCGLRPSSLAASLVVRRLGFLLLVHFAIEGVMPVVFLNSLTKHLNALSIVRCLSFLACDLLCLVNVVLLSFKLGELAKGQKKGLRAHPPKQLFGLAQVDRNYRISFEENRWAI